mgnify:CR=1 FL=1
MRTTVEITDRQRAALAAIADRRGVRGYSTLVQEALDAYLSALDADEIDVLLSLGGSLSEAEADRVEQRISKLRGTWRAVS